MTKETRDALVEAVCDAVDALPCPHTTEDLARAVIPIIERDLLREMLDKAPPEPGKLPPFSSGTKWGTRDYIRKVARSRGYDLDGE